jgi:hypothetical protein
MSNWETFEEFYDALLEEVAMSDPPPSNEVKVENKTEESNNE